LSSYPLVLCDLHKVQKEFSVLRRKGLPLHLSLGEEINMSRLLVFIDMREIRKYFILTQYLTTLKFSPFLMIAC